MDSYKLLGLELILGMALGACAAEDNGSTAVTSAAPGDGSGASMDDGDDGESDTGDPEGDESNGGGDESTSDDPSPETGASASASASDDGGEEESSGGGEGGDPSTGVRGAVIRSVAPAAGQDAIGTLYVGLLVECTADSASAGGATPIEGADLSADGSQVLYEVTGIAAGTYYLVAFLDDNLNADAADPYADSADLVTAEGFAPGCVEVTVVDGQMTTAPAPVNLNLVYPL
jgi:hypothetical protein